MILVDTSVWIDHLHRSEPMLVTLLGRSLVGQHPMVVGELALGTLKDRTDLVGSLAGIPSLEVASHDEVLVLVEERRLWGKGPSLVDAHLIASVLLTSGARLWTRDKRLRAVADDLRLAYSAEKS